MSTAPTAASSPNVNHTMLHSAGLRAGEPIRFRRNGTGRWVIGKIVKIEAEGSITLLDPDGASRSHWPQSVQVKRPGTTGRRVWRTVEDVAATWQQLELFTDIEPATTLSA